MLLRPPFWPLFFVFNQRGFPLLPKKIYQKKKQVKPQFKPPNLLPAHTIRSNPLFLWGWLQCVSRKMGTTYTINQTIVRRLIYNKNPPAKAPGERKEKLNYGRGICFCLSWKKRINRFHSSATCLLAANFGAKSCNSSIKSSRSFTVEVMAFSAAS